MSLWIPRTARPSYASGFARSQAESANPGLWTGLQFLQDYRLGYTGTTQQSVVGPNGTLTTMDSSNWSPEGLEFNGTNEYISVPDSDIWDWAGDFTIHINQVSSVDDTTQILLSHGGWATGWYLDYETSAMILVVDDKSQKWAKPAQSEPISITVVCTGANAVAYYNGNEQTRTFTQSYPSVPANSNALNVGAYHDGNYQFNGAMSSVALYNRALNPSEIRLLSDDSFALVRQRPRQYSVASGEAPPATFSPWWADGINTHIGAC